MLLIPQPRWYEQMILLGSKGSRRHPQGTCEQGRTSAFSLGWRGLGTKKKKKYKQLCWSVCAKARNSHQPPLHTLGTPENVGFCWHECQTGHFHSPISGCHVKGKGDTRWAVSQLQSPLSHPVQGWLSPLALPVRGSQYPASQAPLPVHWG